MDNINLIMELARKAALYDGLINYLKSVEFIDRQDMLIFAGELPAAEDSEEESKNG